MCTYEGLGHVVSFLRNSKYLSIPNNIMEMNTQASHNLTYNYNSNY